MKLSILWYVLILMFTIGCSSVEEQDNRFSDVALACNNICANNPNVSEISRNVGGGMPLILLGKSEMKCICK